MIIYGGKNYRTLTELVFDAVEEGRLRGEQERLDLQREVELSHKSLQIFRDSLTRAAEARDKLQAEVEKLKGPCTCSHAHEYAACDERSTEALERIKELGAIVEEMDKLLTNPVIKEGVLIIPHELAASVRAYFLHRNKKGNGVRIVRGEGGKAECAECGDQDYPLVYHECKGKVGAQ